MPNAWDEFDKEERRPRGAWELFDQDDSTDDGPGGISTVVDAMRQRTPVEAVAEAVRQPDRSAGNKALDALLAGGQAVAEQQVPGGQIASLAMKPIGAAVEGVTKALTGYGSAQEYLGESMGTKDNPSVLGRMLGMGADFVAQAALAKGAGAVAGRAKGGWRGLRLEAAKELRAEKQAARTARHSAEAELAAAQNAEAASLVPSGPRGVTVNEPGPSMGPRGGGAGQIPFTPEESAAAEAARQAVAARLVPPGAGAKIPAVAGKDAPYTPPDAGAIVPPGAGATLRASIGGGAGADLVAPPAPAMDGFSIIDSLGGQRGSVYIPSLKDISEAIGRVRSGARELAGKADIRDNPKLGAFEAEPGYTLAHAEAKRRLVSRNAADIADFDANYLVGRDIPEKYLGETGGGTPTLRELPTLIRERRLLSEGKPVEGAGTLPEVNAKIAAIEKYVPQKHRDAFMRRFRWLTEDIRAQETAAGISTPYAPDYAPRLVMPYKEAGGPGRGGRAISDRPAGFTKQTTGSVEPVERDAIRALGARRIASEMTIASREMTSLVRNNPKFNLNDAIRKGGIDSVNPRDIAIVRFGEKGGPVGEVVQAKNVSVTLRDALKADAARGRPASPNAPLLDEANQPLYVVPKQLAEGLAEAASRYESPGAIRALREVTSKIQHLYLNFPLNYKYHAEQVFQDAANAFKNVGMEHAPAFAGALVKASRALAKDAVRLRRGEYPKTLPGALRRGLAGGRFETYLHDQITDGHIVNDSRLPARLRPFSGGKVVELAQRPEEMVGLFRETIPKIALDEIVRKEYGATPNRAMTYANLVQGNYWRRSPMGTWVSPLSIFLKWRYETAIRLTVRAMEDPATGKWSARGFWASPHTKNLLRGVIAQTLNNQVGDEEKKAAAKVLPRAKSGLMGQGIIMFNPATGKAMKNDKGEFYVFDVESDADIMDGIIDHAVAAVEAMRGGGAASLERRAERTARNVLQSAAPPVRVPLELIVNQRIGSGAPIESDQRRNAGSDFQRRDNLANRGMPFTDKVMYDIEQLLGPAARLFGAAAGGDATAMPRPFVSAFDPRQKQEEDRYEFGDAKYDQFINEASKPGGGDHKVLQALLEWAGKNGALAEWQSRINSGLRGQVEGEMFTPAERRKRRLDRYPNPISGTGL